MCAYVDLSRCLCVCTLVLAGVCVHSAQCNLGIGQCVYVCMLVTAGVCAYFTVQICAVPYKNK